MGATGPTGAPERTKTKYEVTHRVVPDRWAILGEVEANHGQAAITALATEPGVYRAVPVRNITEQAMGNPPPEPPKLVPVDPSQLAIEAPGEFVEPPNPTVVVET